jgi:hypothetical protein
LTAAAVRHTVISLGVLTVNQSLLEGRPPMRAKPLTLTALAVLAVSVPATQAATIHVPDEQPTIQAGINAASHGDTVLVACGTYYEHDIVMKSGVCLRSETGLPDCVTIDGEQEDRVFYCSGVDDFTSFAGLTITGGRPADPFPLNDGGGMKMTGGSSPSLRNCTFDGNETGTAGEGGGLDVRGASSPGLTECLFTGNLAQDGGGIWCGFDSSITLTDCVFESNTADGEHGGGVLFGGSSVTITGCEFVGNDAAGGGGLFVGVGSQVAVQDCLFSGNTANWGGAVHNSCDGEPTFSRCSFTGNGASYGAGMCCIPSNATLEDCTFSENTAGVQGGGMLCLGTPSPSVVGCAFLDNTAGSGGAMHCDMESSPAVTGCVFAGNEAVRGGAILCEDLSEIAVTSSTLSTNGAGLGGGVCCLGSTATITNTIVAFGESGEAVYCSPGASATLVCSDVFGNAGGDWVGCIAGQAGMNGNFSANPLFCLEDNPVEPYALHEGSPCLPDGSPCGELVGAFGKGCDPVNVVRVTSWGGVKAIYR